MRPSNVFFRCIRRRLKNILCARDFSNYVSFDVESWSTQNAVHRSHAFLPSPSFYHVWSPARMAFLFGWKVSFLYRGQLDGKRGLRFCYSLYEGAIALSFWIPPTHLSFPEIVKMNFYKILNSVLDSSRKCLHHSRWSTTKLLGRRSMGIIHRTFIGKDVKPEAQTVSQLRSSQPTYANCNPSEESRVSLLKGTYPESPNACLFTVKLGTDPSSRCSTARRFGSVTLMKGYTRVHGNWRMAILDFIDRACYL